MLHRVFVSVVVLVLTSALFADVEPGVNERTSVPKEIDALLQPIEGAEILEQAVRVGITIDGVWFAFEYVGFEIVEDDSGAEVPALVGVFDGESSYAVFPVDMEEEELAGTAVLVRRENVYIDEAVDVFEVHTPQELWGDEVIPVSGSAVREDGGERIEFTAVLAMGVGSSSFRLDGDLVYLNGDLGSGTYSQVEYLIEHHPEITTIVFEDVPGSVNDEVNVLTGRLVRDAGYTTVLVDESQISSGGVDLFLAGKSRIVAQGARIGVHSWGAPGEDIKAAELPRDHPAHIHQIDYFSYILPDTGVEFYFYTLNAAPAEGIHWMSQEEIKEWGIANK